jgi:hypothetical protein
MKTYSPFELRDQLNAAFPDGFIVADHDDTGHWYKNTKNGRRASSVTTKQGITNKPHLKQWAVNRAVDHVRDNQLRLTDELETVLSEAKYAHKTHLEFAGGVGTKTHNAIEAYCEDWISTGRPAASATQFLLETPRIEEIATARSFDLVRRDFVFIPIAVETRVWYEKGKDCYAGTTDMVCLLFDYIVKNPCEGEHDLVAQRGKKCWCTKCDSTFTVRLMLWDWKSSNQVQQKEEYAEQAAAYAKAIEIPTGWKFDDIWIIRLSKVKAEYEVVRVNDRKRAFDNFIATSRLWDQKHKTEESLLSPLKTKKVIKI